MSCGRYQKTLAGLAAGEPPSAALAAHLAACAACRAELASLRDGLALADATLREIVAHQPSPLLAARIARAVAGDGSRGEVARPGPWLWAWTAVATALLLLVGLAWQWGWRTSPPSIRSSASAAPIVAPVPTLVAAAAIPSQSAAPESEGRPTQQPAARRQGPRGRTPGDTSSPAEPMVLVPAADAEALAEFAAELRQRTVDPGSLLIADPLRELPSSKPIRIEPLELAPLSGADRS